MGFGQAMRGRRDIVARHLRRVHGESLTGAALRRAVDRSFDSYVRYWVESFRIPALSNVEIAAHFTHEGLGHLRKGITDGTGVILALPHLGGWEWAGRWIADSGLPITVIVEPVEPPELFEWFAEYRRSLGMNVVPLGPWCCFSRDQGAQVQQRAVPLVRSRHRWWRHRGGVLR